MNAITLMKTALGRSEAWLLGLVADMKDAPLTSPTPNGGNHPLWVMGHLAFAEARFHAIMFGGEHPFPEWGPMFGRGSTPHNDASQYPSFDEVVARFKAERAKTYDIVDKLTDAELDKPCAACPPGREDVFGTFGAILTMASLHPMLHAGQIADARRAAGRSPLSG